MSDDPASRDGMRWEIRRSLIERLRIPWDGMGDMANQQRAEAAVQISTMMDEIEAWRQAMQKAERDMAELRKSMIDVDIRIEAEADFRAEIDKKNLTIKALTEERDEVVRMANKLTAERDEARREVCAWASRHFKEYAEHIARERGWDCFKENTND